MLKQAQMEGAIAALAFYGIKTANDAPPAAAPAAGAGPVAKVPWYKQMGSQMLSSYVGNPQELMKQKLDAFKPGGMLSFSNVFWPSAQGKQGLSKFMPYFGRVQNAMKLYGTLQKHRDPRESRLSNVLAGAGDFIGSAYGHRALGMLGGGALSAIGSTGGRALGHMLSSKPEPPPPMPAYYPYALPPGYGHNNQAYGYGPPMEKRNSAVSGSLTPASPTTMTPAAPSSPAAPGSLNNSVASNPAKPKASAAPGAMALG